MQNEDFLKTVEGAAKDAGSKVFELSEVPDIRIKPENWMSSKPRAYIKYLLNLEMDAEKLGEEIEKYLKFQENRMLKVVE